MCVCVCEWMCVSGVEWDVGGYTSFISSIEDGFNMSNIPIIYSTEILIMNDIEYLNWN